MCYNLIGKNNYMIEDVGRKIRKHMRNFILVEEANGDLVKYYPEAPKDPKPKKTRKAGKSRAEVKEQAKTQPTMLNCNVVVKNLWVAEINAKISQIKNKGKNDSDIPMLRNLFSSNVLNQAMHAVCAQTTQNVPISDSLFDFNNLDWINRSDTIKIAVLCGGQTSTFLVSREIADNLSFFGKYFSI